MPQPRREPKPALPAPAFAVLRWSPVAILALCSGIAPAQSASPPQPIFVEDFGVESAAPFPPLGKWTVSALLDRKVRGLRIGLTPDPIGRTVGRITVEEGDALDGASDEARLARRYVCDTRGSRAAEMEAEPGGAPSERAEIQLKADRATGAGE